MSALLENGRRVGETRRHGSGGIVVSESSYARRATVATHAHEQPMMCLVLRGGFAGRVGQARKSVRAGAVLAQPRDVPHGHQFVDAESHCLSVQLTTSWLSRATTLGVELFTEPMDLTGTRVNWLAV